MIIARATREGGGELLLLGLSMKNLERAFAGDPVHIRKEVHGDGVPDGWEIVIVIGEDEASLYRQLKPLINQNTVIHKDPRL